MLAIKSHQPIVGQPLRRFHRGLDHLAPKFQLKSGNVDPGVQSKTEEPRLFVLPIE